MSKKIIGITVGSPLPKSDFNQTDPTKGDYIKNKPKIATDEEIIIILVNKGFVDPVTDNMGDILTNANGDILIL